MFETTSQIYIYVCVYVCPNIVRKSSHIPIFSPLSRTLHLRHHSLQLQRSGLPGEPGTDEALKACETWWLPFALMDAIDDIWMNLCVSCVYNVYI